MKSLLDAFENDEPSVTYSPVKKASAKNYRNDVKGKRRMKKNYCGDVRLNDESYIIFSPVTRRGFHCVDSRDDDYDFSNYQNNVPRSIPATISIRNQNPVDAKYAKDKNFIKYGVIQTEREEREKIFDEDSLDAFVRVVDKAITTRKTTQKRVSIVEPIRDGSINNSSYFTGSSLDSDIESINTESVEEYEAFVREVEVLKMNTCNRNRDEAFACSIFQEYCSPLSSIDPCGVDELVRRELEYLENSRSYEARELEDMNDDSTGGSRIEAELRDGADSATKSLTAAVFVLPRIPKGVDGTEDTGIEVDPQATYPESKITAEISRGANRNRRKFSFPRAKSSFRKLMRKGSSVRSLSSFRSNKSSQTLSSRIMATLRKKKKYFPRSD